MLSHTHTQHITPATAVSHTLLLFTPAGSAANNHGLHLLAAAASASLDSAPLTSMASTPLSQKGPFNPAASLPLKVVKRILDLKFVEMSDILVDEDAPHAPLARKDINWSVTNSRLYNETFTGRARAIPRCSYCGQDDRSEASCLCNPNRPIFGLLTNLATLPDYPLVPQHQMATQQQVPSMELCRRYNEGAKN